MKWQVFINAPNQTVAEDWCNLLLAEGIPCRPYPGDVNTFMGVAMNSVRLMTTERYVEVATSFLNDLKPPKDEL